jgi:hypothetical protein
MINLDNEIVDVVGPCEPVAAGVAGKSHRPIVIAAGGIFAPAVVGVDGANRQEGLRPQMTVGAPPQSPRPENPTGRAAVALALVRPDASAPKRNRENKVARDQPTAPRVTDRSADSNRGQRLPKHFLSIST